MSDNKEQVASPEGKEIKEEREISIPFQENEGDCDVVIITKDKDLLLQSAALNMISDVFQECWILSNDTKDGRKVVEMKNTDGDIVIQALSFYFPKFYENLEDSSNFDKLLDLCDQWKLSFCKEHIAEYFFHHHKCGLRDYNGQLDMENLVLLETAYKHKLVEFFDAFLKKTTELSFHFFYNDKKDLLKRFFKSSASKFVYEILKKVIKSKENNNTIEIFVISNFLDLILHENRVPDLSFTKCYENLIVKFQPPIINLTRDIEDESKVIVKVESHEIHINSVILTENSPVFSAMLNSTFKEGQEKIVELPGKKINDILEFFSYLTKPKAIDVKTDIMSLTPLCQEYQVDWLLEKIKEYLENVGILKDEKIMLNYLRVSSDFDFKQARKSILKKIVTPFPWLQACKEFTLLQRRDQICIAIVRLCELSSYLQNNLRNELFSVFR